MTTHPTGKYPHAFYRVSIKAIIRNSDGEVLVVKEKGSNWSLPGGGIDYGENIQQALAREMYEEVLIAQPFNATTLGSDSFYSEKHDAWLMWLVYELTFDDELVFGVGEDGDEAMFIDPSTLKTSPHFSEQLVYKWCVTSE